MPPKRKTTKKASAPVSEELLTPSPVEETPVIVTETTPPPESVVVETPEPITPEIALPETQKTPVSASSETPESLDSSTSDHPESELPPFPKHNHPIPPASHPMQYRAIGLMQGIYLPSQEQWTQGVLVTSDGIPVDAVLLGRTMSLVKKHLDPAQSHLWVVYPRTRKQDDHLHVQIVGVWEPETLKKDAESNQALTDEDRETIRHGYFSIRGEVIFYGQDDHKVVVKIKQMPKKEGEKPKFFKLEMYGELPDRPLRAFWDLEVQLENNQLKIINGTKVGKLFKKRPPFRKEGGSKRPFIKGDRPYPRKEGDPRPYTPKTEGGEGIPRPKPIAKPTPKPKI